MNAKLSFKSDVGFVARCEMDSHADTCVAGPNFVVDEYTGENCDVVPYSNDYQPIKGVPIVNASTAYTHPDTGETVILRFNQVLWYGHAMDMSLLNPNQIRYNGLTLSDDPTDNGRMFGISGTDLEIPFEITGTTVFFVSHVPSQWELDNCRVVELTLDSPWNPQEVFIRGLSTKETNVEATTMRQVHAIDVKPGKHCSCEKCHSEFDVYDDGHMISKMIASVRVATASRDQTLSFVGARDRHSQVDAETVAKRFR